MSENLYFTARGGEGGGLGGGLGGGGGKKGGGSGLLIMALMMGKYTRESLVIACSD